MIRLRDEKDRGEVLRNLMYIKQGKERIKEARINEVNYADQSNIKKFITDAYKYALYLNTSISNDFSEKFKPKSEEQNKEKKEEKLIEAEKLLKKEELQRKQKELEEKKRELERIKEKQEELEKEKRRKELEEKLRREEERKN